MKSLADRILTRALFGALLACTPLSRAQESPLATSPQIFLQLAAPTDAKPAWRTAGIKTELLIRHGRLLPEGLAAGDEQRLAEALRATLPAEENPHQALLATLPRADDLVFDGQRYVGGNLGYIDSMLGKSRRPLAFDRELPTLLVPLTPAAEAALVEQRAIFQANAETEKTRAHADRTYGAGTAALMLADGQFLRAYAGRFDDLYFHLFQNGNTASGLAFTGLADGLGNRAYRPLIGLLPRDAAAPAAFDLSDILTGGGKSAVRRFLQTKSARSSEPFQGFAFRVLPSIVAKARALPAGARFTAAHEEILRALKSRQHFYPTRVPPLYRTPDRFLGQAGSFFWPVANGPTLPPGAADSWYPLPAPTTGEARAELAEDGAASARLFESSSTPDIVWEDPQLSNLLADPATAGRTHPRSAPSESPSEDPRRRGANVRWIAVVTPTAEEANEYLAAIAASDETVRAIEQARGRLRLLRQFIIHGRDASDLTAAARGDALIRSLEQAIAADLAAFAQQESVLEERLQASLQVRADLRSALEQRLRRDRVPLLESLGQKPAETEKPAQSGLVL